MVDREGETEGDVAPLHLRPHGDPCALLPALTTLRLFPVESPATEMMRCSSSSILYLLFCTRDMESELPSRFAASVASCSFAAASERVWITALVMAAAGVICRRAV